MNAAEYRGFDRCHALFREEAERARRYAAAMTDKKVIDRLNKIAALYDELRRIAKRELRRRGPALTLGATTLLHEAYLNLSDRDSLAFHDIKYLVGLGMLVSIGARFLTGLQHHARELAARRLGQHLEEAIVLGDLRCSKDCLFCYYAARQN